jgi:hypothetical protein
LQDLSQLLETWISTKERLPKKCLVAVFPSEQKVFPMVVS